MKKIFICIAIIGLGISCKESNENKKFEAVEKEASKVEKTLLPSKALSYLPNSYESNLIEFKSCKKNNSKKAVCKAFVAKAIGECFEIDDFKKEGGFCSYDQIPIIIKASENWELIGEISEQTIVKANTIVESNGLVVAFNTKENYTHVVILNKGEMSVSQKWGRIELPNCVSYFPSRPNKSFTDKGLNYAFANKVGIQLWKRI